jgi:hypothetical protein
VFGFEIPQSKSIKKIKLAEDNLEKIDQERGTTSVAKLRRYFL